MSFEGLKFAKNKFDEVFITENPVQFVLIFSGANEEQSAKIRKDLSRYGTTLYGEVRNIEFYGVDNVLVSHDGYLAHVAQLIVDRYMRNYTNVVYMLFKTNNLVHSSTASGQTSF